MCSVSLIAIELKGLAAPGEALKNFHDNSPLVRRAGFIIDVGKCGAQFRLRKMGMTTSPTKKRDSVSKYLVHVSNVSTSSISFQDPTA